MILTICSTKGGVSKSTLATNLTVALALSGKDVLLVDGDMQRSAMDFTSAREQTLGTAGYTAVELHGGNIRSQVRQLSSKYDHVIMDVGGRDNTSMRAALVVTEIALIPVQPSSFDLWALEQTIGLIREAKELNPNLRALAVLSIADPLGKDNDEAADLVRDYKDDIDLLPGLIVRRKVFRNASSAGKSVMEYLPKDPKAIAEIETLLNNIVTISGGAYANIAKA